MENLNINKNSEISLLSKNGKNYFLPIPFGFPMYDPYNTGPMSEPILSPVGQPIMARRNPYYPRPVNQFLNPYSTQMRSAMRISGAMPPKGPMPAPGPCKGPGGPMGPMGGSPMPPAPGGGMPIGPRPF